MAATTAMIAAAEAAEAEAADSSGRDRDDSDSDAAPSRDCSTAAQRSSPVRLVVVGGAGVMGRSNGCFVTDTLPGSAVKQLLPIYGAASHVSPSVSQF